MVCIASEKFIDPYLRPLALVALLTLFLTNRRTSIFMNFIFCVIVFLFDSFAGTTFNYGNYPALIMGFTSGIIASLSMDNVYSRLKLLVKSLLISLPTLVCVGLTLIELGGDIIGDTLFGLASGPLAVAVFMIFMPIFEAGFKRVSCFKFSELIEHKSKLIKKMIQQC